ncbi:unnamed protein product [Pieris macdunnoughi]|uniref:Uncharacterized protein n=1 Tax=Pieris macdunnoughi TaxID=345717 RepID=A0A821RT42_9NEOP|nr:unnamed protein product [Pieris macdunnoughi]
MLSTRTIFLLFIQITFSRQFIIDSVDNKTADCVRDIILKNFEFKSQITVIDGDNYKILPTINQMQYTSVQILTSTSNKFSLPFNREYLIITNSCDDFKNKFHRITISTTWSANAKLLVVLKNAYDPRCIFDILLKKHMTNVVLLNDTATLELFTYNPYDDFGCGKRYNRIIKLGHCKRQYLFFDKLNTGIRNCTFQALSAHMPPYSIDPATNQSEYKGIEQYILELISDKEGFRINFTYAINSDEFTVIADNMSAVGPLSALQTGEADIITGAMLLTYQRAMVLGYLTGGVTFTDYLQLHVATAKPVSNLKNIYSEFQCWIWLALFIVFVVYSVLMYLIMRKRPKQTIILKMFGFFLQQSSRVNGDRTNRIFIFWVFFAYLINCCYQSSLVSFTLHPHLDYQISSMEDILDYDLKPCISLSMRRILLGTSFIFVVKNNALDCERRVDSLKKVAESSNHFTIYLKSLYAYDEIEYYDSFGKSKIYTVDYPRAQVLYAIYFYKGFPLQTKLQHLCRRVEEAGLMNRHFDRLKTERQAKLSFGIKKKMFHFIMPWYVLGFGFSLSTFAFILEIVIDKYIRV